MNAIAKTEGSATNAVVTVDATSLMEVISRAARDPQTDVDKLERLMAMYERITDKQAEQQFSIAMQAAQSEMPRIFKNRENGHTEVKYADLESVIKTVAPIYTKHGFSLSFGTADCADKDRTRVTCRVSHNGGHSRDYHADVPLDKQGAKNPTQGFGSAMSYGRRYLTLLIFNIATTSDDDDGHGATNLITQDQVNELADLIKAADVNLQRFLEYVGADHLSAIPANRFAQAKRALEKKVKK